MNTPNTQMLGVSHVQRAKALLAKQDRKLADYWWLFPPVTARDVLVTGGIALPGETVGTYSLVVEYDVPSGLKFVLTHVVACAMIAGALNSAFAPGDGSVIFLLDVNEPLNSPIPQGAPVRGFAGLQVPLGNFATGMWSPLAMPEVFDPLDALRWKITNVSLATAHVFVACGFLGYTLPVDEAQ
jgi:hypothetical protein